MNKLKIFNGFGIKPTYSYTAAGLDFYIPFIKDGDEEERAYDAFCKSYKVSMDDIDNIIELINDNIGYSFYPDLVKANIPNVILLFLSYYNKELKYYDNNNERGLYAQVQMFLSHKLKFDDNGRPGIRMGLNDTLFVNSGIKVALQPNTAGVFMNKSGMGNRGYDVRACVVDEDYAGYVHLSVAYTKDVLKGDVVYCGDKLSQMLILDIHHVEPTEVSEEEYVEIMKDSKRGADGFGSTDVK